MKKLLLALFILPLAFLVSCGANTETTTVPTAKVHLIDAATAKNMLADHSVILVDVRTASEYEAGHISGALLLPLDTIGQNANVVIPDKNATYIIYCRSGNRSAQAASELMSMGYLNIYDLDGGVITWTYGLVTS